MILYIEIDDKKEYSGSLKTCSRTHVCWTHWFFGSYTTKYLYMRDVIITFDVDYDVVCRWKKDEER